MKRTFLLILISLCGMLTLQGQDMHFTQFYATPLTLNPALTGLFDGKYRISAIYRDQWRGALEEPYQSFAASVDLRFELNYNPTVNDAAAGGLLFFSDQSRGNLVTNQMAFFGAFHKALDIKQVQFLSAGFHLGLAQSNLGGNDFNFADQFNGIDGYTGITGEQLPENNISYTDLGVGVHYTVTPNRDFSFNAGGAVHHFNRPRISFYEEAEDPDDRLDAERMYVKYSAQLGLRMALSDNVQIQPRLNGALQGPHWQANAGANFRILLEEYNSSALHLGAWVRPVTDVDETVALDAIVVLAGFELNNLLLGLSYDINANNTTNFNGDLGVFEVSISYLGEYENETLMCPRF